MTAFTPGELAHLDQEIEEGITRLVEAAAAYDHLDAVEALQAFAEDLIAEGASAEVFATMAAGLAVRMHRTRGAA